MADILGIGFTGLAAAQKSLSTIGHNISNANTDGYSRQRVDLATNPATLYGSSYIGNGVNVADVKRVYDAFLVNQVRLDTASFNNVSTYQQLATPMDNILGDANTGLSSGIENFFNAGHQIASNPNSQAARQSFLSQADALVNNFQYINNALNQGYNQVNTAITNSISRINSLASNIAKLNNQIVLASGAAGGGAPNDLLDQRDAALEQLSSLVSVSTVEESNGALNVFIGNGQSLVVGSKSQSLSVVANLYDPTRKEIGYVANGASVNVSAQISGGSLGGLLNYRNQILDPTKNTLGKLAIGMASTINNQHHLGMDLNGNLGGDLFNVASPVVSAATTNTGTAAITGNLVNTNDLTSSDYSLLYNGADSYTLTRLDDGQTYSINTGGSYPYTSDVIDGVSLTINSGAAVGDRFLIRPARAGVDQLKTLISNPSKIAAAVPVAVTTPLSNVGSANVSAIQVNNPNDKVAIQFTSASTFDVLDVTTGATLAQNVSYTSGSNISFNGWSAAISDGGSGPANGDIFYVDEGITSAGGSNTGGAVIGAATMSPPDPALTDAVTITFTSANTFTVTGSTTGSPTVNVPYTDGGIISYNGWNFSISGSPASGDSFSIGPNNNGVGDNGNMQKIVALQNKLTMSGSTATYQDLYGQVVADVGTKTQEASTSHDALSALLQQSKDARNSVSGVNLDEEAANMLRFQQAYQASAKVISTSETLFQSLLSAIGG